MKLDHIGVVVPRIRDAIALYLQLGYELDSDVILVSSQKIYCQYVRSTVGGVRLQLIEPVDETSPAFNALAKGGGLNHLCYSCSDIDRQLKKAKNIGCKVIVPPFKGEGLDNCQAAFVYHPSIGLTEFVER